MLFLYFWSIPNLPKLLINGKFGIYQKCKKQQQQQQTPKIPTARSNNNSKQQQQLRTLKKYDNALTKTKPTTIRNNQHTTCTNKSLVHVVCWLLRIVVGLVLVNALLCFLMYVVVVVVCCCCCCGLWVFLVF